MRCPKCGNEAIYNGTQTRSFDILEVGSQWPVKIMCQSETTYQCSECNTLITTSETRYYLPS